MDEPRIAKITIRKTGDDTHEVLVNGFPVGLIATSLNLSMIGNDVPQVTITIIADEIDVETEAELAVYMEAIE